MYMLRKEGFGLFQSGFPRLSFHSVPAEEHLLCKTLRVADGPDRAFGSCNHPTECLDSVLNKQDQTWGSVGAALISLNPHWLEEFRWGPPHWEPTGNLGWRVRVYLMASKLGKK